MQSLLLCNNSVTSIDNTQLSLYVGYKRKVMLLCNNSVTSIDNTQLSLYVGYKRKVSYSHYPHDIQLYSIFNRIDASGFSIPQVLFVRVLMIFNSLHHTNSTI
jgi:hypothetical protein